MRVGLASSFAAVGGPDARVLILGTLPGAASIARGEYYAHPQNAFWRIMAEIAGADPALPYAERLRCLVRARVAVWDVCAHAVRPGSLHSSIDARSIVANDIGGLLRTRRQIRRICFNGGNAERLFRRLVIGQLDETALAIPRLRLPSTSPAPGIVERILTHLGVPMELPTALPGRSPPLPFGGVARSIEDDLPAA